MLDGGKASGGVVILFGLLGGERGGYKGKKRGQVEGKGEEGFWKGKENGGRRGYLWREFVGFRKRGGIWGLEWGVGELVLGKDILKRGPLFDSGEAG